MRADLGTLVAPMLALAAVAGCGGPGAVSEAVPLGSIAAFERDVQPHLEARCAQGGCHGRPERPLALYAPGQWRRDPARTHLDEPLDPIELERNARALAALAVGCEPAESPALTKPLAGGLWHGGGEVFADETDHGYAAIRWWLEECHRAGADGGAP